VLQSSFHYKSRSTNMQSMVTFVNYVYAVYVYYTVLYTIRYTSWFFCVVHQPDHNNGCGLSHERWPVLYTELPGNHPNYLPFVTGRVQDS